MTTTSDSIKVPKGWPKKAWLKADARVSAIVYSDEEISGGLPAKITDPNLYEGEPYLGVITPVELWTYVKPSLVPEAAPDQGWLVYTEDDNGDVFVDLVLSVEEAEAHRILAGYLGYVPITLPTGSMKY